MQCNSYCERTVQSIRSLILLLFLTACGINKVIIIIIIIIARALILADILATKEPNGLSIAVNKRQSLCPHPFTIARRQTTGMGCSSAQSYGARYSTVGVAAERKSDDK